MPPASKTVPSASALFPNLVKSLLHDTSLWSSSFAVQDFYSPLIFPPSSWYFIFYLYVTIQYVSFAFSLQSLKLVHAYKRNHERAEKQEFTLPGLNLNDAP